MIINVMLNININVIMIITIMDIVTSTFILLKWLDFGPVSTLLPVFFLSLNTVWYSSPH